MIKHNGDSARSRYGIDTLRMARQSLNTWYDLLEGLGWNSNSAIFEELIFRGCYFISPFRGGGRVVHVILVRYIGKRIRLKEEFASS
ncbi:hypothetical protein SAMN05444392_12321 [Seinonella peptonophila]|uniref:Uncharacterized protein n=1 Tax=Seinonella peptonophila TaxID=112248 RepID=A0A1M5BG70_9BACL|nr:hypothetical protein [Seinonella peptonophila]SHF41466.1 hypothetical protein SAMN05444392_12321 [Seinonella peptonophila]